MQQYIRYSIGFLLTLLILATLPAITLSATQLEGTVTADILNVRSEPSTLADDNIVTKLKEGDKVIIKETLDEWFKIAAQAKEGYVHQDYIKLADKESASSETNEPTEESKPKATEENTTSEPIETAIENTVSGNVDISKEDTSSATPVSNFETTIIVNGKQLELEFEPPREKVAGGERLLVPFRAIGETLGIEVSWSPTERKVYASDNNQNKHVVFAINDINAIVNSKNQVLDAPPKLFQNRTMLPLRFFAETFGANVSYDNATKTATVNRVIEVEEASEEVVAEVIEEVKSITPVQLEGMSATVAANILNVRSGSNERTDIIGKLSKDQTVTVIDFEGSWLKVNYQNMIGYVHSGYVELFDEYKQSIKGLVNPSTKPEGERQIVTWSKIAVPTVSAELVDNTLAISSDARLIERMNLENEAIEKITYHETASQTVISVILREGYTAIIYDKFDQLMISIMKKEAKGKRIVIDAGHGAKDPGASANGLKEKDIILDVSLRVQKLLEEAGVEVLMSREDDTFIELGDRSQFANNNTADLFVSVHANASTNTNTNGSETFWNATYNGQQSKKLAEYIQSQLIAKLGTYDRGVKEANFYVIRHTKMPSVLVELGFLTNKEEATRLATNEFRQRAGEAIFQGIMNFYK